MIAMSFLFPRGNQWNPIKKKKIAPAAPLKGMRVSGRYIQIWKMFSFANARNTSQTVGRIIPKHAGSRRSLIRIVGVELNGFMFSYFESTLIFKVNR